MKKSVSTDKAPLATGPFSQAIVHGKLIFTSGQVYLNPDGELLEGTEEEQVRQIMNNLEAVLKESGVSFKGSLANARKQASSYLHVSCFHIALTKHTTKLNKVVDNV